MTGGGIALLLLARLLAVLRALVAAIQQLLLLLHHLLHLAHHLPSGLAVLVEHLGQGVGAQAFEHFLQPCQHFARRVARAIARQLARLFEHLAQVLALQELGVGRQCLGLHAFRHLLGHLFGHGREEAVERLAELSHQALDLLLRGALRQGLHQGFLDLAQVLFGDRQFAFLDPERGIPHQALDLKNSFLRPVIEQAPLGRAQCQGHHDVMEEMLGMAAELCQGTDHGEALFRL